MLLYESVESIIDFFRNIKMVSSVLILVDEYIGVFTRVILIKKIILVRESFFWISFILNLSSIV